MNKVFIFDMDGVLINSDPVWEMQENIFLPKLLGKKIYLKIKKHILGNTVNNIYDIISQTGISIKKDVFIKTYDQNAPKVYSEAKITKGASELINKLAKLKFKLALVSASRKTWIEMVLSRLRSKDSFEYILSLDNTKNLKPKPYPDGYIKAMKYLKVEPKKTIILEDSKKGVQAAKSSGAFTICLRENLPQNYIPTGADLYINKLTDLINLIEDIKI